MFGHNDKFGYNNGNSVNFGDRHTLIWTEINNFCDFVHNCHYGYVTPEIHFELKARVKYVETLWDMYVSSYKQLPRMYFPTKEHVDKYFMAIGKAKMINNKFASENKIWE